MIKKIFAFLTAFSLVTAIPLLSASAETTDEEEPTVAETTAAETEPTETETTAPPIDKTVMTTAVTTAPTEKTPINDKDIMAEIERINGGKTEKQDVEPDTEPNGFLVEKVEKFPDERDFITVSTRDGHVFYIVIEYEGDSKKVYFLNTVDTADLQYLLENGSTVTTKVSDGESKKQSTEVKVTDSAGTTKKAEKEKTEKKKNSNTILYIVGGIGIAVFIFIAKKKVSGGKKNSDDDGDDSGDDYTEEEPEVYVNEDSQEDDYE